MNKGWVPEFYLDNVNQRDNFHTLSGLVWCCKILVDTKKFKCRIAVIHQERTTSKESPSRYKVADVSHKKMYKEYVRTKYGTIKT